MFDKKNFRNDSNATRCDWSGLLRVTFTNPDATVIGRFEFDESNLWSLNIGDSPTNNGLGADRHQTSNNAEIHTLDDDFYIFSNQLPGTLTNV